MGIVDIINNFCRLSFINILSYYVFIKLIGYRYNYWKKNICIILISVFETFMCMILSTYITVLVSVLITFLCHGINIAKTTKNNIKYSIIVTFIAVTITYLLYLISILMSGFILKIIFPSIKRDNIVILLFAVLIEYIIIHYTFKKRRLVNGVTFLKDKNKVNNIGTMGLTFIGIAILIYSQLGKFRGDVFNTYLLTGIIIELICLSIWISKKITSYYKKKLKEQTIEILESEIKEKDAEISRIIEENKAIATINHKYSSRIKSLEKISARIATSPAVMELMKAEFGEEFGDFDKQIKSLSEDFSSEMSENVKHISNLPKTGIFGVDNLLDYMSSEASKSNIKFDLKVNGNINYMVENVIDQSRLETLLGDHIKDAIIAIEHSENTYRSILTIIGIVDECYEVCIYDTGIEFDIDTLVNLGTKAITTHKDTGGSGIGFMTTFETLRNTKASLIIEEKHEISNTDFTKAIRIRFDGKEEYKIRSYRAEEISKYKKLKKILIENI